MAYIETPLVFECSGSHLLGVLTQPAEPLDQGRPGIVIVVGGPQYRIGSHRQFVLQARGWAALGWTVLRFDYRGMGDSGGDQRSFEAVSEDVRSAIDAMLGSCADLAGVVLFGLCDGASAALMYAPSDDRVRGLMLLNPWVRTEESEARATLWHYYPRRLLQPSFWKKVFHGGFGLRRGIGDLRTVLARVTGHRQPSSRQEPDFRTRMLDGLRRFRGRVAIFLSDDDLVAAEFATLSHGPAAWRQATRRPGIDVFRLSKADHTLSGQGNVHAFVSTSGRWLAGASSPAATGR